MKEVHLITEVKLELNNLIHITVPYWLHLWVESAAPWDTCVGPFLSWCRAHLAFPGVKHRRQSIRSTTMCLSHHVLGRWNESHSQRDTVPLAVDIRWQNLIQAHLSGKKNIELCTGHPDFSATQQIKSERFCRTLSRDQRLSLLHGCPFYTHSLASVLFWSQDSISSPVRNV